MTATVVVEPNPGGHRFQAAGAVALLASRTGAVRVLTSIGATGSAEYEVYLAGLEIPVDEVFSGPAPSTGELVERVVTACAAHDADTVVLMEADSALKTWWAAAAGAIRRLPRRPRVIVFLTRYPARLGARSSSELRYWPIRLAKVALILAGRATGTISRAAAYASRDLRPRGLVVNRARDTAVNLAHSRDRARLRAGLGLPADRRLVGIFGGINVRKNPPLLLQAVEMAGPDVDLLLAGPLSPDIRDWLDRLPRARRDRIIVADGFLPNEELDGYLAASDVVALVMQLEGPSGIMGKAMAADVPVITAGSHNRAREMRKVHRGVAAEWSAESIAAGLRKILAGGAEAAPPHRPLPTDESFAADILGVKLDHPSSRRTALFARITNRLRYRGLAVLLRPRSRPDLVRLGSAYGGWWVPESAVRPGAVAYCAGAGEDITFDLALFERGCVVRVFDPTPRAIEHVRTWGPPPNDRFKFVPVGLWHVEAELQFYSPPHHTFVSHSAVNLRGTAASFVAPVKPVDALVREIGDTHIDILKLDIEGAEHRTLDALLERGPLPTVLCVEFDQPQPLRRVVARVRRLQRAGYILTKIEQWNYTFVRTAGVSPEQSG